LLLGLEAGHLDAVPFGLDLLLLGDFVVDRLHDLGGWLQVAQGRTRWTLAIRNLPPPARGVVTSAESTSFHGVRDLGALGDVVDGVLHDPVAHALRIA